MGNHVISLETLGELLEIIESKRTNLFEFSEFMSLAWFEDFFCFQNENNICH